MTAGSSNTRQIGEKTFHGEDQQLFAEISGDCNPMHMDPVAARRLIAGQQVVHGIHILLNALEYWQNDTATSPASVSCNFNNPVSVGQSVVFSQTNELGGKSTIEASVNGLLCATIGLVIGSERVQINKEPKLTDSAPVLDKCYIDTRRALPIEEPPEFHVGKQYVLKPDASAVSSVFPKCHRYLGDEGLASVVTLSFVVGMVCPGLHSVFSSVDIDFSHTSVDEHLLLFSVLKYDPRFRLFSIRLSGHIQGDIKAFLRPPPQKQPSVQDISRFVGAEEFKGGRSLIIGGSRGLGEVTAKILAAGSGEVIITYAFGHEDAKAVCDEINSGGRSLCQATKLDLIRDPFRSINIDWTTVDTIYYFATPRIFRKKVDVFEPLLFREFCEFYIEKFYELCVFLEKTVTTRRILVYFPSTVFVEERPKGMAEYAMVKSAAEILVREINRSFLHLRVFTTRLPRLSTDQTAAILKVSAESNVATLLPVIRSLKI